uniref:Polysaccharide deacetylase n=1 Tax=Solibacter usitatus (strain Ellin6076) TaxID=234267 RepID=Q01VE9_SOLUE
MAASLLKKVARTAFDKGGGVDVARWMNRKGLRILMYHRFRDPEPLARQLRHIRDHYAPVSMAQVAAWLSGGERLPDNALAITIDDGYRDFYQVAYPVFREYKIPATVYLVSGFLDRTLWLWVDQVRHAFLHAPPQTYQADFVGAFELGSIESRKRAAHAVAEAAKKLPDPERLAFLLQLPRELRIDLPAVAPAEYEPMLWEEAREVAAGGIELGAHTCTHPILSRLTSAQQLAEEIAGSKRRIEAQLERAVDHFCYPNGSTEDFSAEAVAAVKAAQYRTSVTTESGLNYAAADRFRLLRIGVEPGLDQGYFQRCAAGVGI